MGARAAGLAAIVGLNLEFYRFLTRRRGWGFAVASVALHYLYYCCCGVSVIIALTYWRFSSWLAVENGVRDFPLTGVRKDPGNGTAVPRPSTEKARRPSRWTKR